jgi:hypothetical protein
VGWKDKRPRASQEHADHDWPRKEHADQRLEAASMESVPSPKARPLSYAQRMVRKFVKERSKHYMVVHCCMHALHTIL